MLCVTSLTVAVGPLQDAAHPGAARQGGGSSASAVQAAHDGGRPAQRGFLQVCFHVQAMLLADVTKVSVFPGCTVQRDRACTSQRRSA